MLLEKCRLWGDYDLEWETLLEHILAVPAVTDNKLIFKLNKVSNIFILKFFLFQFIFILFIFFIFIFFESFLGGILAWLDSH